MTTPNRTLPRSFRAVAEAIANCDGGRDIRDAFWRLRGGAWELWISFVKDGKQRVPVMGREEIVLSLLLLAEILESAE